MHGHCVLCGGRTDVDLDISDRALWDEALLIENAKSERGGFKQCFRRDGDLVPASVRIGYDLLGTDGLPRGIG